jgi:hypothetical protein
MVTEKLNLTLTSGGDLEIPFDRISTWAFRISESRPAELELKGPLAVLRTGDRLAFDPAKTRIPFRTAHGLVDLDARGLMTVEMNVTDNGLHRARFLNGSMLAGLLEPGELKFALKLGNELKVRRDAVRQLWYAGETKEDETESIIVLKNGDELRGQLMNDQLTLKGEFGTVRISPLNIQQLVFMQDAVGRAVLHSWDGSVLRGPVAEQEIVFKVSAGPTLRIHPDRMVSLERLQVLPPNTTAERIRELIALLGAESYRDREQATQELERMPKGVVPLLKSYLDSNDPEVRQRVENVIEKLEGRTTTSTESQSVPVPLIPGDAIWFCG